MKKLFGIVFLLLGVNIAYAKVNAVVSILPQKTFVEAIGGDMVDVALMVQTGNTPHSYEPKPSQMRDIAKADVYFSIGVEFEEAWLPKFKNQNQKMKIVTMAKGIKKIDMDEHHHKDSHDHHHHHHSDEQKDPHIWTSPSNVKIIVKNIYNYLVKVDGVNKKYYRANYNKFLALIEQTDKQIKKILSGVETGSKFMVFHPAWGYFAKDYGLIQLAIEVDGKNPKPKHIMHLIKEAKKQNVKAVFTAPELSEKVAKQIAKEIGVQVIKASPLNSKWSQNLINLAQAIANK
jgi:zinc transport system substrate-binding protein